jgi:hypothetical protein
LEIRNNLIKEGCIEEIKTIISYKNIMKQLSKEIIISSDSLITDIQKAFNLFYPFLKIEIAMGKGAASLKNADTNHSFKKLSELEAPKKLNVADSRTVADVEKDFREMLGLSVQVFRKSGKVWNVISLTDSWTLESQNKAGEFISTEMLLPTKQ